MFYHTFKKKTTTLYHYINFLYFAPFLIVLKLFPYFRYKLVYLFVCFFVFVCLRSATAFSPRGQLPREDLRRSPLPHRPLVTPGPCLALCSLSPRTSVMHPASGPYPPLSSCRVHIPYRVSGLSLPCFPVLHIYSNPTERNPSTYIKPHKQTVELLRVRVYPLLIYFLY